MLDSLIVDLVRRALEEDIGPGDVTTEALIDRESTSRAEIVANEALVVAGLNVAAKVFEILDGSVDFRKVVEDGQELSPGERMAQIAGSTRSLLMAERTALNFLQRMSGIATYARKFVRASKGKVKIVDTRKTAPGLRVLDKYAVRVGGAFNHRMGLYDGVLVKDNHIAVCGGITEAVRRAKAGVPHTMKIEVEVESVEQTKEAIEAGADAVLLDNMNIEQIKEAVRLAKGRVLLEVSGGIGLSDIAEVAFTGVDIVSVGALTHSAPSVDISMTLIPDL